MNTIILEGEAVAKSYIEELESFRDKLSRAPRLKIYSDKSEDSKLYHKSILKYAKKFDVEIVDEDKCADGIISLGNLDMEIPPEKDIEGISPYNLGLLAYGEPKFYPPTPYAAIKILKFYGFSLEGKVCAIVGRSIRVGKPLSLLILMFNGTPIILHRKSPNVIQVLMSSDIVFLSAGAGNMFGSEYFNKNSVIVDISTVYRDGRLVGDAKFEELVGKVKAITPVPGGVGRITTLVLFENLFKTLNDKSSNFS